MFDDGAHWIDVDGDGVADSFTMDTDGNGIDDFIVLDNGNVWMADSDGDDIPDMGGYTDGNGEFHSLQDFDQDGEWGDITDASPNDFLTHDGNGGDISFGGLGTRRHDEGGYDPRAMPHLGPLHFTDGGHDGVSFTGGFHSFMDDIVNGVTGSAMKTFSRPSVVNDITRLAQDGIEKLFNGDNDSTQLANNTQE
jgi:hypothetical protein